MDYRRMPDWGEPLRTSAGEAYLADLSDLPEIEAWRRVWSDSRHGHRYYEILDGTIPPFEYYYLVLEDLDQRVRAVQPLFVHVQDVLEGVPEESRRFTHPLTRIAPGLVQYRTLFVGPSVGEAALGADPEDRVWCAGALAQALPRTARRLRAPLIVLKDFPASLRPVLRAFTERGYTRIPSMPSVALDLDFKDFEEHLHTLSASTRKDLRRKFREAGRLPPVSVEVRTDISDRVEALYPLYLQVYERAAFKFEKLTPDYFRRLGDEMPDRTYFFIWTQEGKPVAFNACLLHDGAIWAENLGMDYRVALDLHLYFTVTRDVIDWACRRGLRRYCSGPLNYDPKLRLGFTLEPLDLYVSHRNRIANRILRRVAPWITPVRHEPLLQRFPNAKDL